MAPTSLPFLAYVILPAWPSPLPLLSQGGIQVHPTGFALGQVHISACQLRSRHMLCSRQSTYIQPIVLQEGAHTIHYLLKSVTSEALTFLFIP